MRKLTIVCALTISLLATSCIAFGKGKTLEATGNDKTVLLTENVINELEVEAGNNFGASQSCIINVSNGDKPSVSITADEALIACLRSKLHKNELSIKFRDEKGNSVGIRNGLIVINLTMPEGIDFCIEAGARALSGADFVVCVMSGSFTQRGEAAAFDKFKLECAGSASSDIKNLTCTELDIDLAGSCGMQLAGKADKVEIDCAGSATVLARDLIAREVSIDAAGSATIEVHASESIDIDTAGSATVNYYGNPSRRSIDTAGSASINQK